MFDKNLQKIELSKYNRAVWEKEKQWYRCQEQKKLLMAVVWGQLDDDTQAQMELATDYAKHRKDGNIVGFLGSLRDICNGSDDGGLSYHPFKAMVAIKSLNLFSSQDVSNIHYFKKELKTKFEATKAICSKFPFGTGILVFAIQNFPSGKLTNEWVDFCKMKDNEQTKWERTYDNLVMAMLLLNNLRNEEAKKELSCSYANGNTNAYQTTLEKIARLLCSQYPMTKGKNKKPPYKNNDGRKFKGKGSDTDSNKDDSGNPLAGAHTTDGAKNVSSTKFTSKSTPSNTAGAHISDSDECDHPAPSQSVQDLLGSYPVDDPFWGGQDYTDD